jgi:hypothetical protein
MLQNIGNRKKFLTKIFCTQRGKLKYLKTKHSSTTVIKLLHFALDRITL